MKGEISMKKVELIDEKQYFVESEKVVQIAKGEQDEVKQLLPAADKLFLAKTLLEEAVSREEYEQLKKEIKELELEVKYDQGYYPMVPEEHQLKVAFNRVYEEEKLDAELAKQKALLKELIDGLENPLQTVLKNIEALENRKLIGRQIDVILDSNIYKDHYMNDFFHINGLSFSSDEKNAENAYRASVKFFKAIKSIAKKPTKTPEVKKPSLKDRLLGGWN